ncbi:ATP-binding protein [Pusillimonas sp. MFBS29]|uniref:ATP-binding protein n=1 Tax=Pusillimonas sp. MFBS29 TaxID=2886690 RepID=UPI001D11FE29|nr:ATP-binding protein [Pusillimonas sp. MFBS29]MCC2596084.1 ATP-binding protein [Pusillimonas sp. MFBS29]
MIEALRGLGYSTATALADIVDNSIAANGRYVDLHFSWDGPLSTITILDDGAGMNEIELDLAMRLGEKSPLDARNPSDLGRFGLGLKTASFSQCRRLTVASCKEGRIECLRWDLDILASSEDDGWYLLEGPGKGSEHLLQALSNKEHGTLVIWELNDRIITPGFREQDFLDLIDKVERHLAMVFHRFLTSPQPKLSLTINGRPVRPWDPFLTAHPATWSSPIATFVTAGGEVEAQGHVLPHKDRLDPGVHEAAAGPDGWTAQQGFYVYRNERLLLAGSWLGLGRGRSWTKEEAHRLARIRLDIPNTADSDWKIDIRKSTARPPVALRMQLTRLAEDTRERARRVFAHRGKAVAVGGGKTIVEAWRAEHFNGGIRYRVEHNHPAIKSVLEDAGPLKTNIVSMLRILEETIPVQRIWLDTAEARETPRTGFAEEPAAEVLKVLQVLYRNMVLRKGVSPHRARELLLTTEPFDNYPEIVHALPDNPEEHYND